MDALLRAARLAGLLAVCCVIVRVVLSDCAPRSAPHGGARVTGAVLTVDCGSTAVDLPTIAFDPR